MRHYLLCVFLPLACVSIAHIIIVKKDAWAFGAVPLWEAGFGANKTWRGMLFVPLANMLLTPITSLAAGFPLAGAAALGLGMGVAYMLSELPNSYLKRSLGIPPGGSHPRHAGWFHLLDKSDSALGVALAYILMGYAPLSSLPGLFLFNAVTHISFSIALVKLGYKAKF